MDTDTRQRVFQAIVLRHYKNGTCKVIKDIHSITASNGEVAATKVAMDIDDSYKTEVEKLEILVRPF